MRGGQPDHRQIDTVAANFLQHVEDGKRDGNQAEPGRRQAISGYDIRQEAQRHIAAVADQHLENRLYRGRSGIRTILIARLWAGFHQRDG